MIKNDVNKPMKVRVWKIEKLDEVINILKGDH